MVINNEAEILGKQQEIKSGGTVAYQKEGSRNENCRSGRSAPRRPAPVRNPPQPARQAPPPAPVQGGSGGSMLGGLGATIAQGMAFGTGSAVAHRAVDTVVGPRTIQLETVVSEAASASAPATNSMGSDACSVQSKAFQ
ncbi:hypothetical protein HYC85_020030 [Camellia sinensis]|uniref:Uncharacterized protein n=1 Tax=Camellia sinensis TaxID=4442 RepID=A0A7J7GSI8_CAMSI|nr:hypothetical protein HYC85_020030 [Camellia sinensis]